MLDLKRGAESSSDESEDDMFGPSLTSKAPIEESKKEPVEKITPVSESRSVKKKRRNSNSAQFLPEAFPSRDHYTSSYEQESVISTMAKTSSDAVAMLGLKNGIIKFFSREKRATDSTKKPSKSGQLTFLRQYSAHPQKEVLLIAVDKADAYAASIARGDRDIKIFDLATLDMIQVVKLQFTPAPFESCLCWYKLKLVVVEENSHHVHLIDTEDEDNTFTFKPVHKNPIAAIQYSHKRDFFISCDIKGMLEYWDESGNIPRNVHFKLKSETDLFEHVRNKAHIKNIVFSQDQEYFATTGSDYCIRVFRVKTGKLQHKIDESLQANEKNGVDGRLLNLERSLQASGDSVFGNVVFDSTGNALMYASLSGIKVVDLLDMKVLRVLGAEDQKVHRLRFSKVLLLNRSSIGQYGTDMLASENAIVNSQLERQPTVVAASYNVAKLFAFNNEDNKERDHTLTPSTKTKNGSQPKPDISSVTLHTTLGDIGIRLFTAHTPKTVENFVGLCQKRYYNNVIFHRVIKLFMIQTGDPLGDGTGGESLWGGHFKDEFSPLLKHSEPYRVSMANAGPATNGSQFFITTEKAPWLDNKHTIFGEVVDGQDTVRAIEAVETEDDRPKDQVVILGTTLK